MRDALDHIARRAAELERHVFFERLQPDPDLRRMLSFAPAVTFWVMSFQDVIRINAQLARDPSVRALIAGHLAEDTGHDDWFLQDLADVFGPASLSAKGVFAPEHHAVRAVSFALASEPFFVRDDRLRLVFLEVLEAAAGVYFRRVNDALVRAGHAGKLRYFGGQHLSAEAGHEMHGAAAHDIRSIALDGATRADADAMIERMFTQMHALGDALVELTAP